MNGQMSSDQRLVSKAKAGDERAFGLLVLKYQFKIAYAIGHYIKNHQEVLDLTQETFIKAYKALDNFREESGFYTWLYRIAVNTAKNHISAVERRVPLTDVDIDEIEHFEFNGGFSDSDSPEAIALSDEVEGVLLAKINALPTELQQVIVMREFEGESYESIAKTMQCPVGTVRSRIHRARETIECSLRSC